MNHGGPVIVIYRHKKRGTYYRVLTHDAKLQCSTDEALEHKHGEGPWTVYQSLMDDHIYIRLTSEFMDGRFEAGTLK